MNEMSGFLKVEVTRVWNVPVGDLGITDFDNLTDQQVLGLFDVQSDFLAGRDKYFEEVSERGMELDLFKTHNLPEKYFDKYRELCKERLAEVLRDVDMLEGFDDQVPDDLCIGLIDAYDDCKIGKISREEYERKVEFFKWQVEMLREQGIEE